MEISVLYQTAKNYAEKIKQEKPQYVSEQGSSLCLVVNDEGDVFSGVTGIKISEDGIESVAAECNAVMLMTASGKGRAKQLIVVSAEDNSILKPCDEGMRLLFRANSANGDCEIILSEEKTTTAMEIITESGEDSEEFLAEIEEDIPAPSLGAPAAFVSGFDFDTSNPFYEGEKEESNSKQENEGEDEGPKYLYERPDTSVEEVQPEESAEPIEQVQDISEENSAAASTEQSAVKVEEKPVENKAEAADKGKDKKDKGNAVSKSDLLKQAKEKKKAAKLNFRFKKPF